MRAPWPTRKETQSVEKRTVIAERVLELVEGDGSERTVVVRLFKPVQVDTEEWRCDFEFDGLETTIDHAFGIDGLQAIVLAIEAVRQRLEREAGLRWLGGRDLYLPLVLPDFVPGLREKVDRVVEQENQRFSEEGRRRSKQRGEGEKRND